MGKNFLLALIFWKIRKKRILEERYKSVKIFAKLRKNVNEIL